MQPLSGRQIEEVAVGSGAIADVGATVTIEWRGWLNRGDQLGSGCETFRIGQRRLIAGLECGVIGMSVGGIRRLRVGPQVGYRDQGGPGIPPNAVLTFEVKLLTID